MQNVPILIPGETHNHCPIVRVARERRAFSFSPRAKRSAYGMDKMINAIGDDVHVAISFEGVAKK